MALQRSENWLTFERLFRRVLATYPGQGNYLLAEMEKVIRTLPGS